MAHVPLAFPGGELEPMSDPGSIVQRIDEAIAALVALRAELADHGGQDALRDACGGVAGALNGVEAPEDWLEISTAAARFNRPQDTIRLWCRQGAGVKRGGRWLANPRAISRFCQGARSR